jgi:hypothetical protein
VSIQKSCIFGLRNKRKKQETMTIKTTIQIINQLKAEKLESNNELIAFYEKKVTEAYANAISKAFN